MLTALDGWLRLLHPMCPYISETLWQTLHGESARLVSSEWLTRDWSGESFASAGTSMRHVMDVVSGIRSIRGEMNISPARQLLASVACGPDLQALLAAQEQTILSLARLEKIECLPRDAELPAAAVAPIQDATVYVPLAGLVDVEEELARLDKAQGKLVKEIAKLNGRISNPNYRANAPEEVVAKAENDLADLRSRQTEVDAAIERMQQLR